MLYALLKFAFEQKEITISGFSLAMHCLYRNALIAAFASRPLVSSLCVSPTFTRRTRPSSTYSLSACHSVVTTTS